MTLYIWAAYDQRREYMEYRSRIILTDLSYWATSWDQMRLKCIDEFSNGDRRTALVLQGYRR